MRALFWSTTHERYVETTTAEDAAVLREAMYPEVTGDLEDEAEFQRQRSGEEDDDDLAV